MLIGQLIIATRRIRALKAPILVVVFSALFALLFTLATKPAEPPARIAGEAQVRLMQDEHALIVDFVQKETEAARAADRFAANERAVMRSLAVAEAAERSVTIAVPITKPARPVVVAARTQAVAAATVPLPTPAARPVLQLQADNLPPPRRAPVLERTRAVIATVERIPHWIGTGVKNVADWAIVGPAQAIARLPERRFL